MGKSDPPAEESLPAPGPGADLKLSRGPIAKLKFSIGTMPPKGSITGLVPAGQAHHLITTFGIVLAAVAGIGGAVLTLHATSDAITVYAELALALVASVLIAVCSRRGVTEDNRSEDGHGDQAAGGR
jgi:hypothetical protein